MFRTCLGSQMTVKSFFLLQFFLFNTSYLSIQSQAFKRFFGQTCLRWQLISQLNKFIAMKLRTQRVHLMGSSNREIGSVAARPLELFEKSYAKSLSSYHTTAKSLLSDTPKLDKTKNPFEGTNQEQQTLRWDPKNKQKGTQTQWQLKATVPRLDLSGKLNEGALGLAQDFAGKEVNMYKLGELKRTFIKKNRKRRDLSCYFQGFATNNKLTVEDMQKIVGQYGYDVTNEEARLIFRLSGSNQDHLTLPQFVELMTKDNVLFRTLKIDGAFGKPRTHFEQRIHLVFRNKYFQLKEAFRIYRMRNQFIDEQKFHYVMKKLDINDLVVSRQERQDLFDKFSEQGSFKAEKLLCAIVEQEQTHRPTFPPKLSDFDDNLMVNQQKNCKNEKKNAYLDFKRMSNLQYQTQLFKARQVNKQLKKISNPQTLVFGQANKMNRQELRERVENVLQSRGANFSKEQYNCFISSLDFNNNSQITSNYFKQFLQENHKMAEERYQRRLRALPPVLQQPRSQSTIFDEATAIQSLNKLKSTKFNGQMRVLFKEFDEDKDGYVSKQELRKKLKSYSIMDGQEVDNLTNYFDEGKGYIDFSSFASKFTIREKIPQNATEPIQKAKSQSEWAATKRSRIQNANSYVYNAPSKYSAWPERLKQSDFSLLQAPARAGQFISEEGRFATSEKHFLGQQIKQERNRIYENKLRKLAAWNQMAQERAAQQEQKLQQRFQANDYFKRLTRETYEHHCHQNMS